MTDRLLLIDTADGVRTLRINRPDKLNALNAATLDALDAAFADAATDDAVRVVVLTGAGPKAFVAGADIAEMNTLTPVQGRDFSLRGMHDNIACERCHKDNRPLAGSGNLCINCHRQDDVHNNSLSPRCGECHTQWSFTPARFDRLMAVERDEWSRELDAHDALFAKLGDKRPPALMHEREQLRHAISSN